VGDGTMRIFYTEKQYKELLSNMVIQIDKREQKNEHIKKWFDQNKISYMDKSFESGDYGFIIKANPDLGFLKDTHFVDELFIERKKNLDELANNFKSDAFSNEIKRTKNIEHKFLIIENGSWEDILAHRYESQYNELAFYRTLIKLQTKYNIHIIFTKDSAEMIYNICRSVLDLKILK
jgi:ERCC4-type nuclease